MTKKLLTFVLLLLVVKIVAQTTPLPDPNFEQELVDLGIDTNGITGDMLIADASPITTLTISRTDITDFTGLEVFTNLTNLDLGNNNFASAPLTTLVVLENLLFNNNDALVNLDLSQNVNLKILDIGSSGTASPALNTLNLVQNTILEDVRIQSYSELTTVSLPTSTSLHTLYIDGHKLPGIFDLAPLGSLQNLTIINNELTTPFQVALRANTQLLNLNLSSNNMTALDVTQNTALTNLTVVDNQLSNLNASNNLQLESLDVGNNLLSTLNLPATNSLTSLNAANNQLSNLNIAQSTELSTLILNHNQFTGTSIVDQFHTMWSDSLAVPPKQLITGTFDVSHNQLSGKLPGMLDIILKAQNQGDPSSYSVELMIDNNELKFEDFEDWHENYVDLSNTLFAPGVNIVSTYNYAPQAKVGIAQNLNANAGENLSIEIDTMGTSLHYQWFKDGIPLPDAPDAQKLTIENLESCDAGRYHVAITSAFFPFENTDPPGTGNKNLVLESNDFTISVNTVKSCVSLTAPLNNATNVPINTGLEWSEALGACGYKISAGTSPSATDLVNNLDVGLTNIYNFAADLPSNSPIYIRITPYYDDGDFGGCAEMAFTTNASSSPPGCASLALDVNDRVGLPIDTDLDWIEANGADGYRITVGTTSGGNDIVDNLDVGNTTTYNFPNDFTEGVTVYVQITPYNSVGDATNCIEENLVIFNSNGNSVPDCIPLNLPMNGATDVALNTILEWFPLANATGYKLSVGTSPRGTEILTTTDVGNVSSYIFGNNLPENETIYVSLRPYNDVGDSFDCAESSFSTEVLTEVPQCAVVITPANGFQDVSVATSLEWSVPTGATGYRLSVGTSSGGNEIIDNEDVGNVNTFDIPGNLPELTQVFVNIVPYNSIGDATNCAEFDFTTAALPTFPPCTSFIYPLNNAVDIPLDLVLEWNAAPTATGYLLSVGTTSEGTNILDAFDVGNTTTHALVSQLPANTLIFAKVTPYNERGAAPLCEKQKFTTIKVPTVPECTTLILPANEAEDVSLTTSLSWSSAEGATGYYLSLGSFPGGVDILNNENLGNVLTYSHPSDFSENSLIYATVTPYNSVGEAIGCVETYFKTETINPALECPSLFTPAQGAINVDISTNLLWNTALNADGYRLSVGTSSGGVDILNNEDVSILTSFDLLDDLPFETEIFVNITAYNAEGNSGNCMEFSFTTIPPIDPAPLCTNLIFPENGATDVSPEAILSWNEVESAEGYFISVGTSPGASDILDAVDAGLNTELGLESAFEEGVTYYVTITPYNAQGNATACTEQQFSIAEEEVIDVDDTKFGISVNGDGINEYWVIDGIEDHPGNTVFIYNSWGNLVFQMENYDNNANVFRGEANRLTAIGANRLPADTYFFQIQINETETRIDKLTGFLVLKR